MPAQQPLVTLRVTALPMTARNWSVLIIMGAISALALYEKRQYDAENSLYLQAKAAQSAGNTKEALDLFEEAANRGQVDAMIELGSYYVLKGPVPVNRDKGERWFRRCAELKHVGCQETLGLIYYAGYGCTPDFSEAKRWMERAKKNGSADAAIWLDNLRHGKPIRVAPQT